MATHLFPHYGNELCVSEAGIGAATQRWARAASCRFDFHFFASRRRSDSFVVICQMRSKKQSLWLVSSSIQLASFLVPSLMMFARVFTIAVQTLHSPHSLLGILGTAQESKVEGRSCT